MLFSLVVILALCAAPGVEAASKPVSKNARCGQKFGGATCQGSKWGNCCSQYSYCGSGKDYCEAKTCQKDFGTCNGNPAPVPPPGRTTLSTSVRVPSAPSNMPGPGGPPPPGTCSPITITQPAVRITVTETAAAVTVTKPAAGLTQTTTATLTQTATQINSQTTTITENGAVVTVTQPAEGLTQTTTATVTEAAPAVTITEPGAPGITQTTTATVIETQTSTLTEPGAPGPTQTTTATIIETQTQTATITEPAITQTTTATAIETQTQTATITEPAITQTSTITEPAITQTSTITEPAITQTLTATVIETSTQIISQTATVTEPAITLTQTSTQTNSQTITTTAVSSTTLIQTTTLTVTSGASAPSSIVANGGFESGNLAPWTLQIIAGSPVLGVTSGGADTGNFKFQGLPSGNPGAAFGFALTQNINVVAGGTYRLSVAARQVGSAACTLKLGTGTFAGAAITPSAAYATYSQTLTPAATSAGDATVLRLEVFCVAGSSQRAIYLDSVSLAAL